MTAAHHRNLACGMCLMLIVAAAQTTGCATSQAPMVDMAETIGLPDSAVARLEIPFEIDVLTIQGVPPPRPAPFSRASTHTLRLLPGPLEIVARYNSPYDTQFNGNKTTPVLMAIQAEPGHGYRFTYRKDGYGRDARIWIEDIDGTPMPALPAETAKPAPSRLKQLKDAWREAGDADRTAFRAWLQDQ